MGLYDTLELPTDCPLPGTDVDPSTVDWQTKSIGRPSLRTFRITPDGRLLQAETHTETVPEEKRPASGDAWEESLLRTAGSLRRVHDGWTERASHGVVRFSGTVDGERLTYEAKFTDGRLVAVRAAGGDDRAWVRVDRPGSGVAAGTDRASGERRSGRGKDPGEDVAYRRTGTRPLVAAARVCGVTLPDDAPTDDRAAGRYVQVLHLPDDRGCRDATTGEPIERGEVYEVLVREPATVEATGDARPASEVVDREGPYGLETAIERAVDLGAGRGLSVRRDVVRLRPDCWTDASDWVTCPDCGRDEVVLATDLDGPGLTVACRRCGVRGGDGGGSSCGEWIRCPSCGSGDVDVDLSVPRGTVWWACDDCRYETTPAPIDAGYTAVHNG